MAIHEHPTTHPTEGKLGVGDDVEGDTEGCLEGVEVGTSVAGLFEGDDVGFTVTTGFLLGDEDGDT